MSSSDLKEGSLWPCVDFRLTLIVSWLCYKAHKSLLSGLNRLYEYWRNEDLESVMDLVSLGVDQSVLLLTSYAAMGKEKHTPCVQTGDNITVT